MEIVYTSKDIRQLRKAINAKRKLDKFKRAKHFKKIFLSISGLIAYCKLEHLESNYFKPRMKGLMEKFGITKMSYSVYHFEALQYFVINQKSILAEVPHEIIKLLK